MMRGTSFGRACGAGLFAIWVAGLLASPPARPARAEEGMWLPDHPPAAALRATYGFELREDWAAHLRRSCVRIEGASGAFVSPRGLVLTNHHVGIQRVQMLSAPGRDLLREGFHAATPAEELPCAGMEVQLLDSIVDVTDEVRAATAPGGGPGAELRSRRRALTRLEEAARERTGRDAEIVTLYGGARHHLYLYKRFDDVRLVFAPEEGIANFGGDVDNFEYPRHAFDVCFFRVYENGRPYEPRDWLRWSADGAREGDLVFAGGHPYRTRRGMTLEQLRFERDFELPRRLQAARRSEVELRAFSLRGPENEAAARSELLGVENWRKTSAGALAGLLDPVVFREAVAREASLRSWVQSDAARRTRWGGAWDLIAEAQAERRRLFPRWRFFEHLEYSVPSDLFRYALTLVEMSEELPRPSEERQRAFRETELESIRLELFAPRPICDPLEVAKLTDALTALAELRGGEDSLVTAALGGLSPADRARQLVAGCTLRDPEERRRLAGEAAQGRLATSDPMIALASMLEPVSRRLRRELEQGAEGPEEEGQTQLAEARLARDGESFPPEATGTLRLSYGTVQGYEEGGAAVPAFTDFEGLYRKWEARAGKEPFHLPRRWVESRGRVSAAVPLNFVSTLDTVGGSSGSPVVDREGDLVGVVFDGNLASLVWDYAWEETRARCIAVDARGIVEGLRGVYGADALVRELLP